MNVEVIVEPGRVYEWPEFVTQACQYNVGSIALDGIVKFAPATEWVTSDSSGQELTVQNFDHHYGVDRLSTGSTIEQVLVAQQGGDFTEAFRDANGEGFQANVFMNASDPDVAGSVYLLKTDTSNWPEKENNRLTHYVMMQGLMDRAGGMMKFRESGRKFLQVMNWIHADFHESLRSGDADSPDPAVHADIIEKIGNRIGSFAWGKGETEPLDTRYEVLEDHQSWQMIKEVGAQGRLGAVEDGAKALVIARERSDDRFTYTLWRKSQWIRSFNLSEMYEELNAMEHCSQDCHWGDSEVIGGSPRGLGSSLDPELVSKVVQSVVDSHEQRVLILN